MATLLLTGLPRSGTTLVCSLLNRLPDTVALAEPNIVDLHGDGDRAVWEIAAFVAMTRAVALETGRVPSRAIRGAIRTMWPSRPGLTGRCGVCGRSSDWSMSASR